jgi:hypothetical protein
MFLEKYLFLINNIHNMSTYALELFEEIGKDILETLRTDKELKRKTIKYLERKK